jgi:hypothetical protein
LIFVRHIPATVVAVILFPALFSVYVNKLLVELTKPGMSLGALGPCDDLLFLSPTRDAMKLMSDTCQRYAASTMFSSPLFLTMRREDLVPLCLWFGKGQTEAGEPDARWEAASMG